MRLEVAETIPRLEFGSDRYEARAKHSHSRGTGPASVLTFLAPDWDDVCLAPHASWSSVVNSTSFGLNHGGQCTQHTASPVNDRMKIPILTHYRAAHRTYANSLPCKEAPRPANPRRCEHRYRSAQPMLLQAASNTRARDTDRCYAPCTSSYVPAFPQPAAAAPSKPAAEQAKEEEPKRSKYFSSGAGSQGKDG